MTPLASRIGQANAAAAALRSELDGWAARVGTDHRWKRYRSQIERLREVIATLLDLATDMLAPGAAGADWSALARGERGLLAANGIWSYFRDKYQLRDEPVLGARLRLADDFAWACYAPVQAACAPDRPREPPLVYFSESWSPFALARDTSFANELHFAESGTAAVLEDAGFRATLDRLPVPLVSVPWLYVGTPPGLLVIAHEVGHVVAADFRLNAALDEAIAAASWDHGAALWQGWREELFADLFAVLAARDGFVGALADLLAIDPARLATEHRLGGRYPGRALRMEIALRALARRDPASADMLRARWQAAYPARPDLSGISGDADRAIDLVLALDCGGTRLDALFGWSETALTGLLALAVGGGDPVAERFDARAALVLAQRLADGRIPGVPLDRALGRIGGFAQNLPTGFRGTTPGAPRSRGLDADLAQSLWQETGATPPSG